VNSGLKSSLISNVQVTTEISLQKDVLKFKGKCIAFYKQDS